MPPAKVILLPSTHESLPSFHVQEALLHPFLAHLAARRIIVAEPPQSKGNLGPKETLVIEVEVTEGTPLSKLQEVLDEFLKSQGLPESLPKS